MLNAIGYPILPKTRYEWFAKPYSLVVSLHYMMHPYLGARAAWVQVASAISSFGIIYQKKGVAHVPISPIKC